MPPKVETVSLEEVAEIFGKTTRTIQNWRAQGMPTRIHGGRPRFVLRECIAWREEQVRQEERTKVENDDKSGLTRKLEAEAALKELDLAERQRELVPVADYQQELQAVIGGLAAVASGRLQRFERDIVRAATPGDARRITQDIYRALMEGAQGLADTLELEANALDAAAAEAEEEAA